MVDYFLTSYDPSDLPGGSVDPLGFERGYLFLADKILPGLTNVASQPRYFSLLCFGIALASNGESDPPQVILRNRREMLLRTERFWALANVLARGATDSGGVRGVTYASAQTADIARRGATRTEGKYRLLSRQAQYGALGMYGVVADGMRFLNRDSLALTPDLGEPLGDAFGQETAIPTSIRRAITDDSDVPIAALREWGERAHVRGRVGRDEAQCLKQALHLNPIRSRMAGWLERYPAGANDRELDRLRCVAKAMRAGGNDIDLREVLDTIVEYEGCYRLAQLTLERLLWLCRQMPSAELRPTDLETDPVLERIREQLPRAVDRFAHILDSGTTETFRQNLQVLADVRHFMEQSAASVASLPSFLGTVIRRHAEVQGGKFDRGRRKMPWLEWPDGGNIAMTVTRVGGLRYAAEMPEQIVTHPYRTGAVDALIAASQRKSPYG